MRKILSVIAALLTIAAIVTHVTRRLHKLTSKNMNLKNHFSSYSLRGTRWLSRKWRGAKRPFQGFHVPVAQGVRLNLGCGHDYREGFVNVDSSGTKCDVHCDLMSEALPFDDASVDYILASHLFEHLPNFGVIMNECHRVLKPGALFDIITPAPCEAFWRDPTHIRPYTASTFSVYCLLPQDSCWATYLNLKTWSACKTRKQIEDFNGDDLHVLYVRMTR